MTIFKHFKFKLAILLFLFSTSYLLAQTVGEFTGTLTMEWIDKTDIYSVSLLSSSSNWDLILSYSNILRETFYDGNQTVWVIHFPQTLKITNSENAVELKLFPDSRPVDLPPEEHVWMALFSGKSFFGKKVPLNDDIGLTISEPCIFTLLESKSAKDASPREALWHNVRSDNLKMTKIESEFRWLAWTNLENGTVIPMESELIGKIGSNIATRSKLVLTAIHPLKSNPRPGPTFEGKGLVYDYRAGNIEHRECSEYMINNDEIPSINSDIVKHPRRVINAPTQSQYVSKSSIRVILITFMLLSSAFFAVLYKLNNK